MQVSIVPGADEPDETALVSRSPFERISKIFLLLTTSFSFVLLCRVDPSRMQHVIVMKTTTSYISQIGLVPVAPPLDNSILRFSQG